MTDKVNHMIQCQSLDITLCSSDCINTKCSRCMPESRKEPLIKKGFLQYSSWSDFSKSCSQYKAPK